jgi:hypothetical protein
MAVRALESTPRHPHTVEAAVLEAAVIASQDVVGELTHSLVIATAVELHTFDSILVEGNGILGTDCHAYSDPNSENELVDSGNIVTSVCVNSWGAQSMRCFYNC